MVNSPIQELTHQQPDSTPSLSSPNLRNIRRRKKLTSKDIHSDHPTSSDPPTDHEPPTSILLSPHINLPITIQFLFVPPLHSKSNSSHYPHQIQDHHHLAKTTPLFSYFDGETHRPIRDIHHFRNPDHPSRSSKTLTSSEPNSFLQNQSSLKQESTEAIIDAAESVPDLKTFESPVKGELIEWCISEGQVLRESDGWRTLPLVKIKEPCTHAVQWHGQCAICGSDLTIGDYTGISETSRASIPMSHGPSTLTVSVSEAQRLESETRSRLLKAQKLSLIVDLDQTIVHATVDPTVGEWMSDPNNPNWSALQGVSRFRLTDGSNLTYEGCYYYLKQRPGLSEFLHSLADQYEMHVYTMGTRAYADAVCKIIDPTGEIFGNRILSRDESGSMTLKSISRLFPVDTSMVVIIDDRGDVWDYSPNLVSVVPYNFFVGIGDINGAFLPPVRQLEMPSPAFNHLKNLAANEKEEDPPIPTMTVTDHSSSPDSPPSAELQPLYSIESISPSLSESVVSLQGSAKDSIPSSGSSSQTVGSLNILSSNGGVSQKDVENTARSKLIADQVLTRPLKQKQVALQEAQRAQKIDSLKRYSSSSGVLPINSSTQGSSDLSNSTVNSSRATTPAAVNPPLPTSSSSTIDASLHPPQCGSPSQQDADEPPVPIDPSDTQKVATALKPIPESLPNSQNITFPPGEDVSDSSDANTDLSFLDEIDDEVPERPVLVDQDTELNRLGSILSDIHTGFYSQDSIDQADARDVISALKHDLLQGVHIAFSSLWPMDAICDQQNLWKLAEQFGACCYTSLSPKVTHLIAAKLGTYKVNIALSRPNVAVVRPKWLLDAVTLWTRPPEEEYSWRSGLPARTNSMSTSVDDEEEFEGDWGVGMNPADWNEARAEVMAALDESDDEATNASIGGEIVNYSSDEGGEARGRSRKRSRTSTTTSSPSFAKSRSEDSPHTRTISTETLLLEESDSPLSKRKKMARSRSSKLKLVLAATDLIDEAKQEEHEDLENDNQDLSIIDNSKGGTNKHGESTSSLKLTNHNRQSNLFELKSYEEGEQEINRNGVVRSNSNSSRSESLPLPDLSAEEDEFLSALAAEMEGHLTNS